MPQQDEPQTHTEPKFRRRAQHRPDEVLDAALDIFARQGYAATSVDEIAQAAGISKGAVYLYFPSKQAILKALVTRAIVPVNGQAIAEMATLNGSVRQALTFLLKTVARRLSDPKVLHLPKVVIREALVAPEIADMYRSAVLDSVIPALTGLVRSGIRSGELRNVDPELTVRTIAGPVIVHVLLAEIFGITAAGDSSVDALVDNHLAILFDGLAAGKDLS